MEQDTDLEQYYNFVYSCDCGRIYGSDKEEKGKHICPICLEANGNHISARKKSEGGEIQK